MIAALVAAIFLNGTLVGCSKPRAAVSSNEVLTKTLLQQAMANEFTPSREVLVDHVEIPPNTTMDWHSHPGEEFHYYLEGEVELAFDGSPSIVGTPGTVAHIPYKKVHTVITRGKGVKIVVFRVHTKGEPVRTLETKSAPAK